MASPKKHECYAPACTTTIHSSRLMCYRDWNRLPQSLQRKITSNYKYGQEYTGNLTRAYVRAVQAAVDYLKGVDTQQQSFFDLGGDRDASSENRTQKH